MDELPKLDRTWLCSVFSVDIVEYSVQSVALQMAWKERLNRYLGVGIQGVPESDRVILDTGDGAAICFLGDPEAAMFCGLRLLGSIIEEEPKRENSLRARMGINLGPVKLVRDINGNLNAIGDGINVGQRVMSFARDNQVLVSRSFYEVVSCLSENYVHLFRYQGVRRDKHVREHIVYELLPPGARQHGAATPASCPAPIAAPERAAASPLLTTIRERIETCFAPIVGPLAHYLVLKASSHASTPLEMCQALMEYVPAREDQERFLRAWDAEFQSELHESFPQAAPLEVGGAKVASSAVTPRPQTPPPTWEPSVLERARKELARYIGPLARILVDRACARARTEGELYEILAGEIASPVDRDRFRRSAPRILRD